VGEPWDIRLGNFTYRMVRPEDSVAGLAGARPSTRPWESLFANQQVPSGKPSIENLRNDDLRWFLDTFSGGEGQAVLKVGDQVGETRYARSVGIDLSSPGLFTLAKEMAQVGTSGGTVTTFQGDTWANVTGSSTVSGDDRKLNNVGDIIKHNLSPAAGNYQVNFYAKVVGAAVFNGSDYDVATPSAPIADSTHRHLGQGSVVQKAWTAPATGQASLAYDVSFFGFLASATFHLTVRQAGDVVADSGPVDLSYGDTLTRTQTFHAVSGVTYTLQVRTTWADAGAYIDFSQVAISVSDTKTARVSIYNETTSTTLATADVDMEGVTSFQRIATLSFTSDGTSTYSMRVKYQAGVSRSIWVDKGTYNPIALRTPGNVELGQGNFIWLFDHTTGSMPAAFIWNVQNQQWDTVGQVTGTGGYLPVALAHSDYYEYVLLGNGAVWYCRSPSTVLQYTATFTNAVGIAVGAERLYVLTEDSPNGTRLWELAVDDAASAPIAVPGSPVATVGGTGSKAKVNPDTTIARRIVGVQDGCAFYVNHGPVATLYHFTSGGALAPITDFPHGFVPRSIAYSMGLVYVGGGFPSVDTDGVTRNRPAVFAVDLASASIPVQLDANLHRTEDPGSRIQDMQLYGTDLWVLTQVTPKSANKKMRLWRVSLTAEGGTFLTQEVVTDESMQSADALAMAVTWRDKVLVWGSPNGAPYVEQDTYITSGTVYLESSIFNFALTEQKLLLSMAVNGDFPAGTSVDLYYSADAGATWTLAGSRTGPGFEPISDVDAPVTFRRLALRCVPRTTDNTVTPSISEFSARAYLIEYAKSWDVLLDCRSETATYHLDGRQLRGAELARNLYALAESGSLVEMADRMSSERPEDEQVYRVMVTNPTAVFLDKGESVIRVTLAER
jgi:hypothetical protein